ncbi:MAG: Na+/H+ antiporter subunit D, partial [Candidatus Krumholzibacteria bacterium]|nr:Na+/H+ antiporter subunit D [Candidatus Krumholzibacteria bacterium]
MISPSILMILGGLALPMIPRRFRSAVAIALPLAALWIVFNLADGATIEAPFMGYVLVLLKVDRLSMVFGAIFAIIAAAGGVYAYHLKETGQQSAALIYGGGALGVAFAGDFFTLLFFTELMALSSTYLVWARRTPEAEKAGFRYILMHLAGGSLMMAGILLHLAETGSIALQHFAPGSSLAPWLILAGVALNGAIPPLHPWLPDS